MDIPELVNGGAATVLLSVVLMVLSGKLVPRRQLDDTRTDFQTQISNAHYTTELWKSAYENSEQRGDVLVGQVQELAEQGRTIQHFIESLKEVSHVETQ